MENYKFLSKFIFRSPRKSIDKIPESPIGISQILEIDDFTKEAIYLSSPNLLINYNREKEKGTVLENTYISFLKYLSRMSTRCTPFGLMAGCGIGEWSDNTSLIISNLSRRVTKLDMQFVFELIQFVLKTDAVKLTMKYYPNNSILKSEDRIRYVEYYTKNGRRFHNLSDVSNNKYLDGLLMKCEIGLKYGEIVKILSKQQIEEQESKAYVDELINSKVLVTELEPNTTGDSPENLLLAFLHKMDGAQVNGIAAFLKDLLDDISELDNSFENKISKYENIENKIKSLGIKFNSGKLFQTNYFTAFENDTISYDVQKELKETTKFLEQLYSPYQKTNLSNFRTAFTKRYENDEIPLNEVMDVELGLGYPINSKSAATPLVDDISVFRYGSPDSEVTWKVKNNILLKLYSDALMYGNDVIQLVDYKKEIESLPKHTYKKGESYSLFFNLIKNKDGKVQINYKGAGMNASRLIGRFANDNSQINEILEEIGKHEEIDGAVVAEIIHLPEARTGNILHRPAFRKYEIPYLGKSTLPKENQIDVNDLMVSVKQGEVILRSKRLNKRVYPKLSNAHSYSNNALPIYHFLCDLQTQNQVGYIGFDWSIFNDKFNYLPRVQYKETIVQRATWNFWKADLSVVDFKNTLSIDQWRNKYKIPSKVYLAVSDNELLIDFSQEFSCKVFYHEIKNKGKIVLKEYLFGDDFVVTDKEGNGYTNEIIAFMVKDKLKDETQKKLSKSIRINNLKRSFAIGSEWLYFKIYCGANTGDKKVLTLIDSLIDKYKSKLKKWFYIRYSDPGFHIRFRLLIKDKNDYSKILVEFNELFAPLLQNRVISSIQTDTYHREIERYGENTMEESESIFHYDSECVIKAIGLLHGVEGEKYRWLYALISIDHLLDDFEFDLEQKIFLLKRMKTNFSDEFSVKKYTRKQINKKYKDNQNDIFAVLKRQGDIADDMEPAYGFLEARSVKNKQIAQYITENTDDINSLLWSYIHMICNRLFVDKHRKHELLIYDFMFKFYQTEKYRK